MNLVRHRVDAPDLRLEDFVQVVSDCPKCVRHESVGPGQNLLGDAASPLGPSLLGLTRIHR